MKRRRGRARTGGESLMDAFLRDRRTLDAAIDRDVERSCTSKQPYASEGEARAVAAMHGKADVLFVYRCRYCEFWHLTRRPNSGDGAEFTER